MNHPFVYHQQMSSLARSPSGPCSVCGRVLPVRRDGNLRIHGPVTNRCAGSGVAPAAPMAGLPPQTLSPDMNNTATGLSPSEAATCTPVGQPSNGPHTAGVINPGAITGKLLKRIPRGSRAPCTKKFTSILDDIVKENREDAWERLFLFSRRCLLQPNRGGHRRSLATYVNRAIEQENHSSASGRSSCGGYASLANRVSAKLEEGDFKGAVRLVCSTEPVCRADETSLRLLQEKHPPSHPDSSFPSSETPFDPPVMSSSSVIKAVFSFPAGSAGGPDGLRPQHLKDLVSYSLSEGSTSLITSLRAFVNFVICGNVPINACPFFFGATLTGLRKSDGGVRHIAVGCSLRRLAAKCLCASVFDEMGSRLFPHQLQFGTPMGAEAVVHAA